MRTQAKTKKNEKLRRGRSRFVLPALLLALLLAVGGYGYLKMEAQLVHLKYAEVYLKDLPREMDGLKLLYVSDLNIKNAAEGKSAARLMKRLGDLNADMLILGGDYGADGLFKRLNGEKSPSASAETLQFIESMADFDARLGKYAVLGEADRDVSALEAAFDKAGIELLVDRCATIEEKGARLILAGLSDVSQKATPYAKIGDYFDGSECVIALTHNPSGYVGVRVSEARDGGAWADLVLSGHTLGGQMKLFGRTLREMSATEARTLAGWYYADDLPMLVCQGLGGRDVQLRLNSQAEVWCMTLRVQTVAELPDPDDLG